MPRLFAACLVAVLVLSACASYSSDDYIAAAPFQGEDDPRHVSLCIVFDGFTGDEALRASAALGIATDRFEEFDLRFYALPFTWKNFPKKLPPSTVKAWTTFIELKYERDCDITVALTNQDYVLKEDDIDLSGLWHPDGNWILVDRFSYRSFGKVVNTIQHELGHAFGAVHVSDKSSVMHKDEGSGTHWDAVNHQIILLKRDKFK